MDVSTVREVHVGAFHQFAQPRPDQEGHLHAEIAESVSTYDSKRAATIVDLTVYTDDTLSDLLLGYVAAHCPLHSLILHPTSGHGRTHLKFPGAGFSNLRHLAVTGLPLHTFGGL